MSQNAPAGHHETESHNLFGAGCRPDHDPARLCEVALVDEQCRQGGRPVEFQNSVPHEAG